MSREAAYREAREQAEEKKVRLLASVTATKDRIAPARLKQDAKAKIAASINDGAANLATKVQQHPFAAGAGVTAFFLYLARRPLAALFGRWYVRLKNRNSENEDG